MGHYSEYYEEEDRKKREREREENLRLLEDLRNFNQRQNHTRLARAGCQELFARIEERVMARLYQGD